MKTFFLLISSSVFIFFFGCQSKQSERDIYSNAADTTSVTGLAGDSVKLIKTASIDFKVKDARQSARAVSQLAKDFGGMVSHQSIESVEDQSKKIKISDDSLLVISSYTINAEITAVVPSGNLGEFINYIEALGYFTSSNKLDIDDKSLYYLATDMKQQNRRKALHTTADKKLKGFNRTQIINTSDEVTDQEMLKRQIDADVNYSTVRLRMFQNPIIRKEVIASDAVGVYRLSFSKSLSSAFSVGWEFFLSFIITIAHFWMFILMIIVAWLCFRNYKGGKLRVGNPQLKS